jgi:phage terminase large subunit
VDNKTIAQLGSPAYKSDSSGRIAIEKKTEMKNRGIGSPDRAEAVLLALYEPKKNVNISMPVSFTQENPWRL